MWESSQLSCEKSLLEPMSKRKFVCPNRCFPTRENLPTSPSDIGSQYPSRWYHWTFLVLKAPCTRNIFRVPHGTIKKNLNFPCANMKWFVIWQWESTMIPLFHNGMISIKHWNTGPLIFRGELSLYFVNSTLICQRFPLFSLPWIPKKFLVFGMLQNSRCCRIPCYLSF